MTERTASPAERFTDRHMARFRLRLDLIDGPELRCPHCGEWWPITTEHWEKNEWHLCVVCKREKARLYAHLRQRDTEYRTAKAAKSRRYRAWLNNAHPQYVPAYDRERRARRRAETRARRDAAKNPAA